MRSILCALILLCAGPGHAQTTPDESPAAEPADAAEPTEPVEVSTEPVEASSDKDSQSEAGGASVGEASADELPILEPPTPWREWRIEGRLLESEETVRGFLEPVMQRSRTWRNDDQRTVKEFCERIGYHLAIRNQPVPGGQVLAILNLEPVTRVRNVVIDIKDRQAAHWFWEPLFGDELGRRMLLRPGSTLR